MSVDNDFEKNENSRFADDDTFAHRVVKHEEPVPEDDAKVEESADSADSAE